MEMVLALQLKLMTMTIIARQSCAQLGRRHRGI